ncbi:MAG: Sir2 family NAD-dependent protein deacetylase, partial [Gammaproteobacteria bacterium]
RREAWQRKFDMDNELGTPAPNGGHLAVNKLVQHGIVNSIITQNIDGLHQASGIPPDQVIELHGNNTYARCLNCQQRYELEPIKQQFLLDQTPPTCTHCGGVIKSAVISFGQSMPPVAMAQAEQVTRDADLFIAIGSSLQVYPAAGFPQLAAELNIPLVILNREPTGLDHIATLVLNTEITPLLKQLTQKLPDS